MNKLDFSKFDALEKIGGGLLGVIAIVAAIVELILGGVDALSIAGAIKDISGTLIVVMVLLAALKHLVPKKAKNFKEAFENEMVKVLLKYNPIIAKDTTKDGRYNIASRIDAIHDNNTGDFHTLFDFDYKNEMIFVVSKTLFMGRSKEDFSSMQKGIIQSITSKITRDYEVVNNNWKSTSTGFNLTFNHELCTAEDAMQAAEIVDTIILLYIAGYKK
ncbi:MAG: hypothetical protein RBR71_09850 [Gudongella sp.]|nr:hypothetical protein [Gudongella sp.]